MLHVTSKQHRKENAMEEEKITLELQGIDEMGLCAYFSIKISDDYTMKQLVDEVKRRGFVKFRIVNTMKCFANVI